MFYRKQYKARIIITRLGATVRLYALTTPLPLYKSSLPDTQRCHSVASVNKNRDRWNLELSDEVVTDRHTHTDRQTDRQTALDETLSWVMRSWRLCFVSNLTIEPTIANLSVVSSLED